MASFTLNDKTVPPAIGLGTWKARDEESYEAVKQALNAGYRHIDTAAVYLNEKPVGDAVRDSGIPREDIYITTKLWCTRHNEPVKALKESLEKLGLEYVDLYLMHWPVFMNPESGEKIPLLPNGKRDIVLDWSFVKTFELMQECVKLGLAKSIGVSNFSIKNLKTLLDAKHEIKPVVNQVELHPFLPQLDLNEFCQKNGIVLEAYSPLGSDGAPVLKDATLQKLAEKYSVSPSVIVFSWMVQSKVSPLPKSVNPVRIKQNLQTIELTQEDIELINNIHKTTSVRYGNPDWSPLDVFEED